MTLHHFPQTVPTDDAWKINSEVHGKHAITTTPAQHKRKDLTKSIDVMPAEYPPKVNSELLNSRVVERGKIMRTLVGEGIGAFIVVGHEHSLVGLEVFSFWEPPWSVIYEIPSL